MDGFTIFTTGIILSLFSNTYFPDNITSGLIVSSVVIGAVAGGYIGGILSDKYGRKRIFIFSMLIISVAAIFSSVSDSIPVFILFQLLIGFGIGMDFPVSAAYVQEFMPIKNQTRMLAATLIFQAAGTVIAAVCCIIIMSNIPPEISWRYIIGIEAVPPLVLMLFRLRAPESPRWCYEKGYVERAAMIVVKIFPLEKEKVEKMLLKVDKKSIRSKVIKPSHKVLFSKEYLRRTVLSSGAWFLMDVSTFGIGIFTPILLAQLAIDGGENFVKSELFPAWSAGFVDVFLIAGFFLSIMFVPKYGPLKLQALGFGGMAGGMLILLGNSIWGNSESLPFIFLGFIVFNVMMNMGPNSTTFMLPAELYPTQLRGTGGGFAASFAKIGAALAIFFLPGIRSYYGIETVLLIMVISSLLGMAVTIIFGRGLKLQSDI